jgi:hypothetical protein
MIDLKPAFLHLFRLSFFCILWIVPGVLFQHTTLFTDPLIYSNNNSTRQHTLRDWFSVPFVPGREWFDSQPEAVGNQWAITLFLFTDLLLAWVVFLILFYDFENKTIRCFVSRMTLSSIICLLITLVYNLPLPDTYLSWSDYDIPYPSLAIWWYVMPPGVINIPIVYQCILCINLYQYLRSHPFIPFRLAVIPLCVTILTHAILVHVCFFFAHLFSSWSMGVSWLLVLLICEIIPMPPRLDEKEKPKSSVDTLRQEILDPPSTTFVISDEEESIHQHIPSEVEMSERKAFSFDANDNPPERTQTPFPPLIDNDAVEYDDIPRSRPVLPLTARYHRRPSKRVSVDDVYWLEDARLELQNSYVDDTSSIGSVNDLSSLP